MRATFAPRYRALRLSATAVICLLFVGPVLAQQPDQSVEFQSFRSPGWSFTPAIAIGVTHDSNVALSSPRASLGETQGDSMYDVVPSGQLEFFGKRTDFSAGYRGFVRRYMNVRGLDGFDQRSTIGFKHAATKRLNIFARDSYADAQTTDEVEVNGVPFRRIGARTNMMAAGMDYRLTKFTTLGTRYDMTWVDFDRSSIPGLAVLTGGWIHALRADLSRRISERLAFGGEYGYRTATLGDGREFSFQDAGGTLKYSFGPHTSGSVAGGLGTLHDRVKNETRTGPYVRLGITHALEVATLSGGFERQYVPSFGFGGASSSQELRGGVFMPIGKKRFYVEGSAAWRRTSPLEANVLRLDTVWLRSTLGYSLSRWARAEGLYTYTRQDSIVTGGEVDRHRVGVLFVISQPMRIQ